LQVKTIKISVCIAGNNQGETVGVFTLMILEIANQDMKISSASKTCDMSYIWVKLSFSQ
jgi:hypothetical protein